MSKKIISILLSAALLVAMFCVGFGAVNASAADDTVTYYFLAPDSYLVTNGVPGAYWWQPAEPAAWPGIPMEAAPEVGDNVFKVQVPAATTTVIFNAYVDGAADPDNAHQTVNINTEGYEAGESAVYPDGGLDDFHDMIYVINPNADGGDNDLSGEAQDVGDWFSINEADYNYYKNSEALFAGAVVDTPDTPNTDTDNATDSDKPVESKKTWKAGATVTVTYYVGNIPCAGSFNEVISYNPEYLEFVEEEKLINPANSSIQFNADTENSQLLLGALFAQPVSLKDEYTTDFASADKAAFYKFTFKALKDFNEEDLGLSNYTEKWVETVDDGVVDNKHTSHTHTIISENQVAEDVLAANPNAKVTDYVELKVSVTGEKLVPDDKPTDTDKPADSNVDKPSDSDKSSDKGSDTKETADPDSSKKTTSSTTSRTTTTGTTSTVQTAGTFAVISLVVILMASAGVVIYTRKKTEE